MEFSVNGNGVEAVQRLEVLGQDLRFRASDVRRERTGIHARLSIIRGETLLAFTQCNVERDEDRTRLVNTAWQQLTGGQRDSIAEQAMPKSEMKHSFDLFASQIWTRYLDADSAEAVAGDPMLPIEFLAQPHILREGGTIMFAPPERAKSYTALLFAISVDAGVNQFWKCGQTRAMYINLERGPNSIRRRIGCVNTVLGEDPHRSLLVYNSRGRSLMDIRDSVARTVAKHNVGFLVLDSISRTGMGKLVEDQPTNRVLDTLNGLCPTWLAIAHTPRADETHAFGSQMWDAGADIMLRLLRQRQGDALGVGLQITKANDLPPQPLMVLKYEFDEYGLSAVSRSKVTEFPELTEGRDIPVAEQVMEYLQNDAGSATATQIATALDKHRPTISTLLSSDQRFVMVKQDGREKLYGVKTRGDLPQ